MQFSRLETALVAALALGLLATGCAPEDDAGFARAYIAKSPAELIGGDVAMARVGDIILENDKIRIGLLGSKPSPGPGVFGGTLVDADLQRPDSRFRAGSGRDQFAEMFPFANLLVPRPDSTQIQIINDGSNGEAAVVRVEAEGAFFLEALSILQDNLLGALFRNVKVFMSLRTDYILEPGTKYVKMVTEVYRSDPIPRVGDFVCDQDFTCDKDCPNNFLFDPQGCPTCECAPEGTLDMVNYTEPSAIFPQLLGDDVLGPGVVAGDFVFFGGQNDLFAPGIGFDEDKAVFDALFQGQDTFTSPIDFDYMAATGEVVSYGFFTAGGTADGSDPRVLVPIITSSATAFVTAGQQCSADTSDDTTCDQLNRWRYERYFVVGDGDVASIADTIYEVRGTPTGRLEGVVLNAQRQPYKNGRVFVFRDPFPDDPNREWTNVRDIVDQNYRQTGRAGLLNRIDADVGLDMIEDGDFSATLPAGKYLLAATNSQLTSTSEVQRVEIKVGETAVYTPVIPLPGRLLYQVLDGKGQTIGCKLSVIALDEDGNRLDRDGTRRPWMGESRLGNGIRHFVKTHTGMGEMQLEPGYYELVVSVGPEYSVYTEKFRVAPGQDIIVKPKVFREVDTSGWIAGDFHLHAEPSFDSGMKLETRVITAVAEGLEFVVSTDHDVVTDYGPVINELDLQERIKSSIGVEMSTLELGHFTTFPLEYDDLVIPDHLAPDWSCKDGPELLQTLDESFAPNADGVKEGVKVVAHPRDGFIGYVDQLGVETTGNQQLREPDLLEANNILLSRSTCDFDGMELYNSKRFDLIRQPTNREVIIYNRCYERLDLAEDVAALDASCPELTDVANGGDGNPLASCDADLRFFECKQRYRRELAFRIQREILIRTPEEQELNWRFDQDPADLEDDCSHLIHTGDIPTDVADMPCTVHPGTYDDWMRWLDNGLAITITAASDSHGHAREAGMPRTLVRHDAGSPDQIDERAMAKGIRDGKALPTYGPFVELKVGNKEVGEVASVTAGETFEAQLRVQTASWFGVDRIEIYVSGVLEGVINLDHGPEVIDDFNGSVVLTAPEKDGFVSVVAMGTRKDLLMGPVYLDVAFGELQLPRVASLAFSTIPVVNTLFTESPIIPDFFPVFPMATTNALFLDVDGDGEWRPSDTLPPWCPRDCAADEDCPTGQVCGEEQICIVPIEGICRTQPPLEGALME